MMNAWNDKILDAIASGLNNKEIAECFTAEQAMNMIEAYAAELRKGRSGFSLIIGNPVDGFELYGVFDTEDDAVAHANQDGDLSDTWVAIEINPIEAH